MSTETLMTAAHPIPTEPAVPVGRDGPLVLSLFPGIGLLDMAFEEAGFCVVRGPDLLWGGNVRRFHPPAGRFEGVIGGPPCQAFSRLAHMVRQNGLSPKFGNLIPEFERVIAEAAPAWFLMEEVQDAPVPKADGYGVHSFLLNNRHCWDGDGAATQHRVRRWSFGHRGGRRSLHIEAAPLENVDFEYAATGGSARPIALGGSSKPKAFRDGKSRMPWNAKSNSAVRELARKQDLPDDFDLPPFTVTAKCQALGNGVPLPMGRAVAAAVRRAIGLPALPLPPLRTDDTRENACG